MFEARECKNYKETNSVWCNYVDTNRMNRFTGVSCTITLSFTMNSLEPGDSDPPRKCLKKTEIVIVQALHSSVKTVTMVLIVVLLIWFEESSRQ